MPNLGTNLAFDCSYYSPAQLLFDVFKTCDYWRLIDVSNGNDLGPFPSADLDADGWPLRIPPGRRADAIFRLGPGYPAGDYVVRYTGAGTIEYSGPEVVTHNAWQRRRDILTMKANPLTSPDDAAAITLSITATDPSDPIRNIRVLLPGAPAAVEDGTAAMGDLFTRKWKAELAPYNTIRCMHWAHISDVDPDTQLPPSGEWSKRTKLTDAFWGGSNGAPIELMITAANATKKNLWFNIPHNATDQWVRNAAQLGRDRLDANLRCYLEYTNEAWNYAYPYNVGNGWIRAQGKALWPGQPDAQLNWYALRAAQIFRIWREEWLARPGLTCVLAGQASNPGVNEAVLRGGLATSILGRTPGSFADAFAIAPYFGGPWTDDSIEDLRALAQQGPDAFLARARADVAGAAENVREAKVAAAGLPLLAYEGGHHYLLDAPSAPDAAELGRFLMDMQRDPRFEEIYTEYLDAWQRESGSGLFVHFNYMDTWTPGSMFGAKSHHDDNTPKHRALVKWAGATAPPVEPPVPPPPEPTPAPEPPPVPPPVPADWISRAIGVVLEMQSRRLALEIEERAKVIFLGLDNLSPAERLERTRAILDGDLKLFADRAMAAVGIGPW